MKKSALLTWLVFLSGSTALMPVKAQEDLIYVAVDPCRIVDTRNTGGAIAANAFRNFRASGTTWELAIQGGNTYCIDPKEGTGQKPLAISAYVIAVPATGSTAGVLTAYPSDQLPPPVGAGSTVNFDAGEIVGNTTNITLCEPGNCPTDGEFAILARSTNQHVVIDVQGYFYPLFIEGVEGTCPASTPTRFVDNGDGTICDSQTGLMWEKQDGGDGEEDLSNPRDVDNNYNWSSTGHPLYPPDGTVFTDFLARLNNTVASSASDTPFSGHTDWRIPTIAELQTIVDCSFGVPCIDPIFGPTAWADYWSSTTSFESFPSNAWSVYFASDIAGIGGKTQRVRRVRAVRGGR